MPGFDFSSLSFVDAGAVYSFQSHHLIPTNVYNSTNFRRLFVAIETLPENSNHPNSGPFNINDFRTNGMYLPDSSAASSALGFARHNGSHPAYDRLVERVLTDIQTKYDAALRSGAVNAAQDALDDIRGLQAYLKTGLVVNVDSLRISTNNEQILRPLLVLNATDPYYDVGTRVANRVDVSVYMDSIASQDVMNSQAFQKGRAGIFVDLPGGAFDPIARNSDGKLLSARERFNLVEVSMPHGNSQLLDAPTSHRLNNLNLTSNIARISDIVDIAVVLVNGIIYAKMPLLKINRQVI